MELIKRKGERLPKKRWRFSADLCTLSVARQCRLRASARRLITQSFVYWELFVHWSMLVMSFDFEALVSAAFML